MWNRPLLYNRASHAHVASRASCARHIVDDTLNTRRGSSRRARAVRGVATRRDLPRGVVRACSHQSKQTRLQYRGFTLIELMIALVIAALLISLGLPSFSEFLRNSEIRSTSESIVNGLRMARSEAANRNQPVTFALAGGGSAGWTVIQVSDGSLIQQYSKQEGATNTAVAIQPVGAVAVTFNGLGRVVPAAAAANPNLQQLDISSILASGSRPLRIYVDDARGIRICDPSPLLAALVPRDARTC
jgi:type IV fimbrial biogenesis protein FimT